MPARLLYVALVHAMYFISIFPRISRLPPAPPLLPPHPFLPCSNASHCFYVDDLHLIIPFFGLTGVPTLIFARNFGQHVDAFRIRQELKRTIGTGMVIGCECGTEMEILALFTSMMGFTEYTQ